MQGTKLVENSQVNVPSWFNRIVSGQGFSSGPATNRVKLKCSSGRGGYKQMDDVHQRPQSILYLTQAIPATTQKVSN